LKVEVSEERISAYKKAFRNKFKILEKVLLQNGSKMSMEFFQLEIINNRGVYNYVKAKLTPFQSTRNLMQKFIIINQVVHFTRMVLADVESENSSENIQLVLFYMVQKKRGAFVNTTQNNQPLLIDMILVEKFITPRVREMQDVGDFFIFYDVVKGFYQGLRYGVDVTGDSILEEFSK